LDRNGARPGFNPSLRDDHLLGSGRFNRTSCTVSGRLGLMAAEGRRTHDRR
jgi:hypothetical protein